MSYLYETHLHTNVGSRCGISSPEDYIHVYKAYDYTGIFVTDHFFNGNCAIDQSLPWERQVDGFLQGYLRAKEAGEKAGLDVFFGWEARLGNDEYLVYGLDRKWLLMHPEIVTASHKEQYELVHAGGGAVIQAHPYRERDYETAIDLWPGVVDGIEGYNLHDSVFEDQRSRDYARQWGLCMTAGSDVHDVHKLDGRKPFGVRTANRLASAREYADLLRAHRQLELSIPGEELRNPRFSLDLSVRLHEERQDQR